MDKIGSASNPIGGRQHELNIAENSSPFKPVKFVSWSRSNMSLQNDIAVPDRRQLWGSHVWPSDCARSPLAQTIVRDHHWKVIAIFNHAKYPSLSTMEQWGTVVVNHTPGPPLATRIILNEPTRQATREWTGCAANGGERLTSTRRLGLLLEQQKAEW